MLLRVAGRLNIYSHFVQFGKSIFSVYKGKMYLSHTCSKLTFFYGGLDSKLGWHTIEKSATGQKEENIIFINISATVLKAVQDFRLLTHHSR